MWLPYASECRQLDRVALAGRLRGAARASDRCSCRFRRSVFRLRLGCGELWFLLCTSMALACSAPGRPRPYGDRQVARIQPGDPRPKMINHRISPRPLSVCSATDARGSPWTTGPASATNAGRDARRVRAIATEGSVIRLRTFPFETGSLEDRLMPQAIRGDQDLDTTVASVVFEERRVGPRGGAGSSDVAKARNKGPQRRRAQTSASDRRRARNCNAVLRSI
jgi:hypothetical protein